MWSLPDITRLNSEAADTLNRARLEKMARTGKDGRKKLVCEWADHDTPSHCEGQRFTYLVYDIFSDDPKSVLTLCEHHDGYYGSPSEGYFTCEDCNKTFVENYTWENYYHVGDGFIVCLPCYAARELDESANWIPLTNEAIEAVTEKTVRKAKHLIAVRMPMPKGIEFVNNVEFDSMDGHCISGGGVSELQETLRKLQSEGHKKAILILDAAYQFAVSIGVYIPTKGGEYDV